jgi:hypothetical protein
VRRVWIQIEQGRRRLLERVYLFRFCGLLSILLLFFLLWFLFGLTVTATVFLGLRRHELHLLLGLLLQLLFDPRGVHCPRYGQFVGRAICLDIVNTYTNRQQLGKFVGDRKIHVEFLRNYYLYDSSLEISGNDR